MPSSKDCPACDGKGRCFRCKGKGKTGSWITTKCRACGGGGICPRCKGSGRA